MAEALFRLELEKCGLAGAFGVASCGVSAYPGETASVNACRAVAERGGDLSAHRARRINDEILANTLVLVALTKSHLDAVREFFPAESLPPHVFALSVPDPFGATLDGYRSARNAICEAFPRLVEFLKNLLEAKK